MTILGRSEELVPRCVECDLAEPESLASLGGSAPGVVDGILSDMHHDFDECINFLRQYIVKRGANPTVNIAMAVTQDSPSSSVTLQQEELNISAIGGVKRKIDDDTQPLPKVENRWYKKKEFRHLLKAGLGDKLRKIREAARERDEAVEHEKLTTKKDEPGSGKKMHSRKGKPNDAKGSRD